MVDIKIPASLRKFCEGQDTVSVDGSNVREAFSALNAAYPGITSQICDDKGNVRRFVNVYCDQEDIRFLDNMETALSEGSELQIIPAIAGG